MPSNREKVISYLGDAEAQAFNELVEKENLTRSEAVNYLIQNQLLTPLIDPEELVMTQGLEERLELIETGLSIKLKLVTQNAEKTEKLEEQIAYLENEVQALTRRLKEKDVIALTDDHIAAVTGQRVQTVWEWRHGLRKPRGERILKALEPYEIRNGTWVTKR